MQQLIIPTWSPNIVSCQPVKALISGERTGSDLFLAPVAACACDCVAWHYVCVVKKDTAKLKAIDSDVERDELQQSQVKKLSMDSLLDAHDTVH